MLDMLLLLYLPSTVLLKTAFNAYRLVIWGMTQLFFNNRIRGRFFSESGQYHNEKRTTYFPIASKHRCS
jgi:hypothetical protein